MEDLYKEKFQKLIKKLESEKEKLMQDWNKTHTSDYSDDGLYWKDQMLHLIDDCLKEESDGR